MKLPPRLLKVAEFIPPGRVVADIGTDHALLPLHLLESGRARKVIAVEVGAKPYAQARGNLEQHPLGERVELRLGDGLQALSQSDGAGVAVIAGMGGGTIRKILSQRPPDLDKTLEFFILQPMSRPRELRAWLPEGGFSILDEALAKDEGRIYEVFLAVIGTAPPRAGLPFGLKLLENRDPHLKEYLEVKIRKTRVVLDSLARSRREDREELLRRFAGELEHLERLMDLVPKNT